MTFDPESGEIPISGYLSRGDEQRLLILVHGLGGSAESLYLRRSARLAHAKGLSVLRVNLRGADGSGCDFFHAGLTQDLHTLLASPVLAAYEKIWVLGYSVGGHVVLKLASEVDDFRVKALAAICSPLDLEETVRDFDRPSVWPYRRHVFKGLFAHYASIAGKREVPTPVEELLQVRSLRRLDALTVVPRFGFGTAENYYAEVSAFRSLPQLRRPALLVATEADPMVTARSVRAGLSAAGRSELEVVWSRLGGHVGFPAGIHLGLGTSGPVDAQVQDWLLRWE